MRAHRQQSARAEPRTSFVGREREIAALRAALDASALVTVVGAGGAGKTRLLLEVMRRGDLDAIFCDVSGARSNDAMALALASVLGLEKVNEDSLASALSERPAGVIVLDNLEQLLPGAATTLDRWLGAAPQLRFVVTSRAPTHLAGERLVEVAALALPTSASARDAESCVLFVDRARALVPGQFPSDPQWRSIAQIVTRLDGLPLAIELAASRARTLNVDQIASQLSSKLDLLASRDPTLPPRHATLRCAVEWSWDLLCEAEQAALRRLSLFSGGFDLDGAAAVMGRKDAVDAVQSLCDQSLIRIDYGSPWTRYRLFECVRDYAAEKLAQSDDLDDARRAHDAYAADIAQRSHDVELAVHVDDLVEAHRRALCSHIGGDPVDSTAALRIALALEPLLLSRGPASLLLRMVDEALVSPPQDDSLLGHAHLARGHVLADMGRFDDSQRAREQSLAAAREASDRALEGKALASLGRHAWHTGRSDEAMRLSDEAIAVFEELADEVAAAQTRSHRANFRWLRGRVDEARRDYLDALNVLERHEDRRAEALALGNLASLERDMGFMQEARAHFERCIELLTKLDDSFHRGTFTMNFAGLLLECGDVDGARESTERALTLHREVGNRRWEGIATAILAQCDEERGDLEAAQGRYALGSELAERFGHPVMHAMVLCWQARLAADRDDPGAAERYLSRARGLFRDAGATVVGGLAEVADGHIELAKARAHREATTSRHVQRARSIVARLHDKGVAEQSGDLRIAIRRLEDGIDAQFEDDTDDAPTTHAADDALIVRTGTRSFRPPDGRWHDSASRGPLWRVLLTLCERRESAPGQAITAAQLVEAGWPGERMTADAATGRIYNAIATLRRKGLRGVLIRRGEGYVLDPDVPFAHS